MSRDVVGELRAKYEAGTKGEWTVGYGTVKWRAHPDNLSSETLATCCLGTLHFPGKDDANAALIVAMHRHLPALLAVVEAAQLVCLPLDAGPFIFEQMQSRVDKLHRALSALTTDEGEAL